MPLGVLPKLLSVCIPSLLIYCPYLVGIAYYLVYASLRPLASHFRKKVPKFFCLALVHDQFGSTLKRSPPLEQLSGTILTASDESCKNISTIVCSRVVDARMRQSHPLSKERTVYEYCTRLRRRIMFSKIVISTRAESTALRCYVWPRPRSPLPPKSSRTGRNSNGLSSPVFYRFDTIRSSLTAHRRG